MLRVRAPVPVMPIGPAGSVAFATDSGGLLWVNAQGLYSYTPAGFGGIDEDIEESFTYTVADTDGETDTATLLIGVQNFDDGLV